MLLSYQTDASLFPKFAVCGAITRADVAELVVKALISDKASGKVLSAVDSEQVFGAPEYGAFEL